MRKPTLTFKRVAHRNGGVTIRVARVSQRGAKPRPFALIVSDPNDWEGWSVFAPGADADSDAVAFAELPTEAEAIAYVRGYSDAKYGYLGT